MTIKSSTVPSASVDVISYGMIDVTAPLRYNRIELMHQTEPDDELFALLEYYSEVDQVGDSWLKSRYPNFFKRRSVYVSFRAFIRQAKAYYLAAKGQDFSISPLDYFYSFENLVRAYLTIKRGNTYKQKEYHGLDYKPQKGDRVYMKKVGVFADFYNEVTKTVVVPDLCLNINSILGYCLDIAYDYNLLNGLQITNVRGKSAFVVTRSDKKAHILLAMTPPFTLIPKRQNIFFRDFKTYFEEVQLTNEQKRDYLGLNLNEQDSFSYFLSKDGWDNSLSRFLLDVSDLITKHFLQAFFRVC